jgi:cell division protein FtsI (penicillin-binding protein 3)
MDTRLRLTVAASVTLLPLPPLAGRLAQLQVMQHTSLESRAAGEFSRSLSEAAPRADLLDRHGNILARSVPVWGCFLDKRMSAPAADQAATLAVLLRLPPAELAARIRAPERFVGLNYEEAQGLGQARIEGLGLVSSQERFYPNGSLGRGLLGLVSSEGRGASGVELAQDSRLSGKARRFKIIRDGSGKALARSLEEDSPPPQPLALTIDRTTQYYAEEALQEAAAESSLSSRMIAVQDTYEPGSTFKIVTAAAVLEESLVREDESFFCENGAYAVSPGVVIHDHEPSGQLTLSGILERSSNIGIAKVAGRLGAARFYRYSRAFGFGSRTGVGLPGETGGEMKPLSDLTAVGLAAASYGYGVGVSPLQVLSAYSAVANGGLLLKPKILQDAKKAVKVRRVISPPTAAALARMLEGVVERGTGLSARIPGYGIAGKTGTARRLDPSTHRYSTSQFNASFAGFLPTVNPRWTILVILEDPKGKYYGAQVAAPVFGKLARRLLSLEGIPPDRPATVRLAALGARSP